MQRRQGTPGKHCDPRTSTQDKSSVPRCSRTHRINKKKPGDLHRSPVNASLFMREPWRSGSVAHAFARAPYFTIRKCFEEFRVVDTYIAPTAKADGAGPLEFSQ